MKFSAFSALCLAMTAMASPMPVTEPDSTSDVGVEQRGQCLLCVWFGGKNLKCEYLEAGKYNSVYGTNPAGVLGACGGECSSGGNKCSNVSSSGGGFTCSC